MVTRLLSLLVWAAVGASVLAWGLKFWGRGTPVPAGASVAQAAPPAGMDLSRVLGTPPPQPVAAPVVVAADSRFKLLGLAAPGVGGSGGLALIAVDGKPARTWRVGREVEPGLRLLAVSHRRAELGVPGAPPTLTLELPPLAEAQRGRPGDGPGAMPGVVPGAVPGVVPGAVPGLPPVMSGAPMGATPGMVMARPPGALAAPAAPVVVGEPPVAQPVEQDNSNAQR
jgi:general secretion pathway protein C